MLLLAVATHSSLGRRLHLQQRPRQQQQQQDGDAKPFWMRPMYYGLVGNGKEVSNSELNDVQFNS